MTKRKARSDRNHVIYQLLLPQGNYIGVTVKDTPHPQKSAERRMRSHWHRLTDPTRQRWNLYRAMQELGTIEKMNVMVLEVVRGKEAAHKRERELIRELRPTLNTDTRGMD